MAERSAVQKQQMACSEATLMQRLRARFPAPEYAFLPQVASSTGAARELRVADALAMGCWPSRGIALHGFEIKVSRADWLRELRSPQKAEAVASYCDHWWIVAGSGDIVRDGELPATWGLLVPHGNGLCAAALAPALEPQPMTRSFLASVLRAAAQYVVKTPELTERYSSGYEAGRKCGKQESELEILRLQGKLKDATETIRAFEQEVGFKISGWLFPDDLKVRAGALKFALNGGIDGQRAEIARIRDVAAKVLAAIDGATGDPT